MFPVVGVQRASTPDFPMGPGEHAGHEDENSRNRQDSGVGGDMDAS